jgi:hypothetical protein
MNQHLIVRWIAADKCCCYAGGWFQGKGGTGKFLASFSLENGCMLTAVEAKITSDLQYRVGDKLIIQHNPQRFTAGSGIHKTDTTDTNL